MYVFPDFHHYGEMRHFLKAFENKASLICPELMLGSHGPQIGRHSTYSSHSSKKFDTSGYGIHFSKTGVESTEEGANFNKPYLNHQKK